MLSKILWGIVFVGLFAFMFIWDSRKKNKKYYQPTREKTKKEKETEIAIEKEKSRRFPGTRG